MTERSSSTADGSTPSDGLRTTVDTVVAAGQLLADPRKCRIWHGCWLQNGLDVKELGSTVSIPQSTLYNLTKEMVTEGSLYESGAATGRSTVYKPVSMQIFVSEHPEGIGPQFNIHGTLIGVVGAGTYSEDVERKAYVACWINGVGVSEQARFSGRSPETVGNLLRRAEDKLDNEGDRDV